MINAVAVDDEPLALEALKMLCEQSGYIHLTKTFTSPKEALKYLRKFPADLIFCDIEMPEMTGISLINKLRYKTMVIFTSAFPQYAAASYELSAIDYLLKPIPENRFSQALVKVQEHYAKNKPVADRYIFIRANFSLVQIQLDDIEYIEGLADYIKIHVFGRKTIIARKSMKDMLEKLPGEDFIRIHRSYILPLKKIEAVKGTTIFINGKKFPIGKTYISTFLTRYFD